MRLAKKSSEIQEGDLTPMIDMTFQLIAFFMVLINFSQNEANERIQLPQSELAKPAEGPLDYPITLHLTKEGSVILSADEVEIDALRPLLVREANVMELKGIPQSDATIIIRAHKATRTGKVQALIKVCQDNGFENFALRAKEKKGF